jgi:hypothetical protein
MIVMFPKYVRGNAGVTVLGKILIVSKSASMRSCALANWQSLNDELAGALQMMANMLMPRR